MPDGRTAADGYEALRQYDKNLDNEINPEDAVYHTLCVWRDLNQDGISQEGELFGLAELGIHSLRLKHQNTR